MWTLELGKPVCRNLKFNSGGNENESCLCCIENLCQDAFPPGLIDF